MKANYTTRLNEAEQICLAKGIRLTPIRKSLLEIIYSKTEKLTAYELLRLLRQSFPNAESMTVYRALDFLQTHGFIHRIATQNSYTACDTPQHHYVSQILLCEKCGQAQEINAAEISEMIQKTLLQHHFRLSAKPLELVGICQGCL